MKKRRVTRRGDNGITRQSIIKRLNIPRTIPDLDDLVRRSREPMDVTVRTAIKNMLEDGVIEAVDKPYSCFDAVIYKLKGAQ